MAADAGLVQGKGVVFLHGAGGRAAVWQLQALAFPAARVPDLPGRDGSSHPRTISDFLDALGNLLAEADVLVGHSLGGAIALAHALRASSALKGLVLVGTAARLRVRPEWIEGLGHDSDRVIAEIVDHFFAPQAPERLKRKTLEQMRQLDPRVILADFQAADGFDVRDRLGGILVPTLVLCGALDRMVPLRHSEALHASLPRSNFVAVDEAGHMVMLERPRSVNEAIKRFLETLA